MKNKSEDIQKEHLFSISNELGIKRVTPSHVRSCEGFKNATDEEVEAIIESLYLLAILSYKVL